MSKAILYDATLCTGCKQCERACAKQDNLPYDDEIAAEEQSAHKYTVVQEIDGKFMRKLCLQCNKPACATVNCGVYRKLPEGPVVVIRSACIGCGLCLSRCPFEQVKPCWTTVPFSVRKCEMCYERVTKGLATACATVCPTGATKFGDRDALLAEAKERIRQNPDKYVNHIYGENEVGGTSVLLLSSVPFEKFGWPTAEELAERPPIE
ncbi:MAG: 4Fe-4S ferredoxin [Acidobacteria bacterium]|nr:MAG: 4Fe-4S ferredoxin [Acidobacteriota bacterium]